MSAPDDDEPCMCELCVAQRKAREIERRADLIDRAARAVFLALFQQAGRTALPADFEKLQPATRERCEVVALRVLSAVGMIP